MNECMEGGVAERFESRGTFGFVHRDRERWREGERGEDFGGSVYFNFDLMRWIGFYYLILILIDFDLTRWIGFYYFNLV